MAPGAEARTLPVTQCRKGFGFLRVAQITCASVGLILTLVYITKRLSEEEEEMKRNLVRGKTALLIYSEGRGLHTSDSLPCLAPSRRVRLLHQPALALRHRLPSPAAYYRLPPPSPPPSPPRAPTTGFHRLPPLCAPMGRDTLDVIDGRPIAPGDVTHMVKVFIKIGNHEEELSSIATTSRSTMTTSNES